MQRRALGQVSGAVSALALGTYELRSSTKEVAQAVLNLALDLGINYIDTAPCYGESEVRIGQALAHRRDEYMLVSKCGCIVGEGVVGHPVEYTRENMERNLAASLKHMRTDHLDGWMLHAARPEDIAGGRMDDAIVCMQDHKAAGDVRFIGVSFRNGGPPDPLFPAGYTVRGLREFLTWSVFDAYQVVYGALTRTAEAAIHEAQGVGIISRGALRAYTDQYDALFEGARLSELLADGETRQGFLIRFVLSNADVSAALVGTQNVEHLRANVSAASAGPLPADIYLEAKRRLDRIGCNTTA